jgi:hypothetical protein
MDHWCILPLQEAHARMKKLLSCAVALALATGFGTPADAHDPPGVIYEMWQWPSTHLPTLDADFSDWDAVPEELWLTEQDFSNLMSNPESGSGGTSADVDPDGSDLAVRLTFGWNDDTERIYMAYDRFDDFWSISRDDIELTVDADHSGGAFWQTEGMSDEEAARFNNSQAQGVHFFNHGALADVGVPWNWHWSTSADWHIDPPYAEGAFDWTSPELGQEYSWQQELWSVWWDDFIWDDPTGSVIHDMQEGEIIHLAARNKDGDIAQNDAEGNPQDFSDWALNLHESSENADFLPDWELLPVQVDLLPTAVENDSWGHIKASFK